LDPSAFPHPPPGPSPSPRRPEVAVRRRQAIDPLVRPLEVVMIDEQPEPLPGLAQIKKHRRLDALPPQRSPEALDLAQRLRPPRPDRKSTRLNSSHEWISY